MTGSYYFWKWAENDLPGKPVEVHAALLRGELHPALQPFDVCPLLARLEEAAEEGRARGEEWDWKVHPGDAPELGRFVFVTCPEFQPDQESRWKIIDRFYALDLSGFDEAQGQMIEIFLPKLNCFEFGDPKAAVYDITVDDLPGLLRKIPYDPERYGRLTNRWNHFVNCVAWKRRFTIEWRENYDITDLSRFDQWRAESLAKAEGGKRHQKYYVPEGIPFYRVAHGELRLHHTKKRHKELFSYAETLKVFEAFLRGEGRPTRYHWRNINSELS